MWRGEGECPGKVCPAKIAHRSYIICFVGMICIRYISNIFLAVQDSSIGDIVSQ